MDSNSARIPQSPRRTIPIHQQRILILAIPVTCLVTSLLAFGWLQLKTEQAEEGVQHTQHVRLETKRLLTTLLDAETAVRGYEISRRREFLNRYESAIADIPVSLAKLRGLVADDHSQTHRLQKIHALTTARLNLLEQNLQLFSTLPDTTPVPPEFVVQLLKSKEIMDQTRTEIEVFLAEEERLQTERNEYLQQQWQLTWLLLGLSAVIGIGGAVLAAYLLNRLERKLAERNHNLFETEARYRAVVENFPNGAVLLFDSELRYLIADGRSLVALGLSKEQLEGKTLWECLQPETCSVLEPIYRQALAGRETTTEITFANHIFLVYVVPLRNEVSEVIAGMIVAQDITERKQAEEALRDSEAKFRAFLESASEAIIVTNANGEIVVFNAKAEDLFGYNRTDVLGRTVEFLMPQRYHQSHTQYRDRYLLNPTKRSMSQTKDLFAQHQDGTEFPIEAGLSSIQTQDGIFVMTFLTDITKRKQAQEDIRRLNESLERRVYESETRYQQIVELVEEGIWVVDHQAKTTYVNQAITKMLGYTESELLGHPISDFISEGGHRGGCSLINCGTLNQVERCELNLKTKAGKNLWTYMSVSPSLDENGKMLWSCILVYDITERKQAEERLQESNERISLANAELARATRLKDEFLANMSHELRTPLNAILGLAEALQEEVYGELTERQRKSLVTIEQSGKHLLELINDILDLSKIESGKMALQIAPVSLQSLCESSLTFVKQQAHQKNIRLISQIPEGVGEIKLDERRIRQVLVNLLSNAVKFTPDGGEVSLQVTADPAGELLQFSIIDTGIGIAPENLDRLFQPFVQLDSSLSRRYAGTGLGLALVRRLVELHGGSISLESEVGKGSRFTVNLPLQEAELSIARDRDTADAPGELPNIHQALIVEDSDASAKQIARYLGELGAAVLIHPQGEGTIEAVGRFDPDVIILDILLPNVSGWEVLAQLKANPVTKYIPVLVISVVDERIRALELGASEYLLKPISRQQLQLAMTKIFATVPQSADHTALVVTPQESEELPLILLAEDNEANISTLMDYLQVQGFRVSLARNGLEAVQNAKEQKPELILMDIQMPEMDGLEAIRQIRAEADLVTIPIIALTALAMPGDRERCLAVGATEYMTKPVRLKNLVRLITQYLNKPLPK